MDYKEKFSLVYFEFSKFFEECDKEEREQLQSYYIENHKDLHKKYIPLLFNENISLGPSVVHTLIKNTDFFKRLAVELHEEKILNLLNNHFYSNKEYLKIIFSKGNDISTSLKRGGFALLNEFYMSVCNSENSVYKVKLKDLALEHMGFIKENVTLEEEHFENCFSVIASKQHDFADFLFFSILEKFPESRKLKYFNFYESEQGENILCSFKGNWIMHYLERYCDKDKLTDNDWNMLMHTVFLFSEDANKLEKNINIISQYSEVPVDLVIDNLLYLPSNNGSLLLNTLFASVIDKMKNSKMQTTKIKHCKIHKSNIFTHDNQSKFNYVLNQSQNKITTLQLLYNINLTTSEVGFISNNTTKNNNSDLLLLNQMLDCVIETGAISFRNFYNILHNNKKFLIVSENTKDTILQLSLYSNDTPKDLSFIAEKIFLFHSNINNSNNCNRNSFCPLFLEQAGVVHKKRSLLNEFDTNKEIKRKIRL